MNEREKVSGAIVSSFTDWDFGNFIQSFLDGYENCLYLPQLRSLTQTERLEKKDCIVCSSLATAAEAILTFRHVIYVKLMLGRDIPKTELEKLISNIPHGETRHIKNGNQEIWVTVFDEKEIDIVNTGLFTTALVEAILSKW